MLSLRTAALMRRTLAVCREQRYRTVVGYPSTVTTFMDRYHSRSLPEFGSTGCLQLQSSSNVLMQSNTRHYRSQPTHGIGRFRHLLPPEDPKKKGKTAAKEIKPRTDFEYGVVNLQITGYNMTLVEHFSQYIHNFCNRYSVKVEESYANPTKTTEVMHLSEHGNKMFVDSVLTFHERVIQVSGLSFTFIPILIEVLTMNQPEGVNLLLKEHTQADYQARFKARPDLENLMASMS